MNFLIERVYFQNSFVRQLFEVFVVRKFNYLELLHKHLFHTLRCARKINSDEINFFILPYSLCREFVAWQLRRNRLI
jgi:hypothetical protein